MPLIERTDFKRSNDFLKMAVVYFENKNNDVSANRLVGNIGNNYARMGDYENAIAYFMKCLEFARNTESAEDLSITLNSLGVVYSRWQQPDMAIRFFEEAIEAERPLGRPLNYANRNASLAREYLRIDAIRALPYIKEALEHGEKIELPALRGERIAFYTVTLGDIYSELDSLENAARSFRQSLAFFEDNGRTYYVATTLLALGRLQMKAGQWREAAATLKRCEEISLQYNYALVLLDALRFLGEAHSRLEPNAMGYFYIQRFTALNDSVFRETSQRQISEFQVRYETAEKELEIERQQSEIERQRMMRNVSFAGALLVVGFLIVIVRLRNKRNRALTERNNALAERNNALAEMNATKDKFFSIVSHDMKNPAVAQRDAMIMLLEKSHEWDFERIKTVYRSILKSANENVELLHTLLDWAQVQSGRIAYVPSYFDLAQKLKSEVGIIQNMAETKGVALEMSMPDSFEIFGDRNILCTVTRNLLVNGVKFTEKGGTVELRIENDAEALNGGKVVVSVSDTGVGMSDDEIERLFRLSSAKSRRGTAGEQGNGLGLVVCKELLEMHGSGLNVESKKGKGSRFWFEVSVGG